MIILRCDSYYISSASPGYFNDLDSSFTQDGWLDDLSYIVIWYEDL